MRDSPGLFGAVPGPALLHGAARKEWQHSAALTRALRYSIMLRTASARRR